jgi:hypothetical protein
MKVETDIITSIIESERTSCNAVIMYIKTFKTDVIVFTYNVKCSISNWPIISSISVSLLTTTISLGEMKENMYKLPINRNGWLFNY